MAEGDTPCLMCGRLTEFTAYCWNCQKIIESSDDEVWKPVKSFENYQVSNFGRVKSKREGRFLGHHESREFYTTTFITDGKTKRISIHHLVAKHFLENPHNYKYIQHKDGNKKNNYVDNLEWIVCTHVQPKRFGKDNPGSRMVKQYTMEGKYIRDYFSVTEATRVTGIPYSSIYHNCAGRLKHAGGYRWKFFII